MFLVIAYRMGQITGYSYPVGVFSSYEKALEEAKLHRSFRGGKYDHRIFELKKDYGYDANEAKVVGGTGNFDLGKGV